MNNSSLVLYNRRIEEIKSFNEDYVIVEAVTPKHVFIFLFHYTPLVLFTLHSIALELE